MFGEPLRLDRPDGLARIGFVAQDHPLYRRFTVADLLHFGRSTNPRFDAAGARERLAGLGISPAHRAAKLSGGQQAQVALTLALAGHQLLVGPRTDNLGSVDGVIAATHGDRHSNVLVRLPGPASTHPRWESHPVGLEELVLAYLGEGRL